MRPLFALATVASLLTVAPAARAGYINLGEASNFAVLGLTGTDIKNNNVTIHGDEGVSQSGTLKNMGPSTVTGNVYQYMAGQYSGPGTLGGSIITNPTLMNQTVTDALSAAAQASALAPTQTLGTINADTTVNGNGG